MFCRSVGDQGLGVVFAKWSAMKVNRSGAYYLMTSIASVNTTRSARSDTWGTVAVVILLFGVVSLMRLVLTV